MPKQDFWSLPDAPIIRDAKGNVDVAASRIAAQQHVAELRAQGHNVHYEAWNDAMISQVDAWADNVLGTLAPGTKMVFECSNETGPY